MIRKIVIIFTYIIGIFIFIFVLLINLFFIFYEDNNKPNDLDFMKIDLVEVVSVSEKNDFIPKIADLVRHYVDPIYLQHVYITTFVENGMIRDEIIKCTYNTYNKEAEEYGKVFVRSDLITGKVSSITGSYGYFAKEDTLLETDEHLIENLNQLNHYLQTARKKMKEINKNNLNYDYDLVFKNNKISINTSQENYRYDRKAKQFKQKK